MNTIREWMMTAPRDRRFAVKRFLERKLRCERCGQSTLKQGSTEHFSVFDLAYLCAVCATREQDAPGYLAAKTALDNAHAQHNWEFEGVGLNPDDEAFLHERVAQRYAKRHLPTR